MPNSSVMRMEAIVTVTMIKKCAMIPRFFNCFIEKVSNFGIKEVKFRNFHK